MEYFFQRLVAYIKVRPTPAMMNIIVKIMVEVISILGVVTKEVGQGQISMPSLVIISQKLTFHAEKYLKKLFGFNRVEDALQRLDKLTQEEARMAAAETLTVTREIDDNVKDVGIRLEGVDEIVQGVDMKVEDIDDKVQNVDSKVQGIDDRTKVVDDRVKGVDDRVKGIDDRVEGVDERVKGVDERVEGVDDRLKGVDYGVKLVGDSVKGVDQLVKGIGLKMEGVDHTVQGIDDKVDSVIKGELLFPQLVPDSVLSPSLD